MSMSMSSLFEILVQSMKLLYEQYFIWITVGSDSILLLNNKWAFSQFTWFLFYTVHFRIQTALYWCSYHQHFLLPLAFWYVHSLIHNASRKLKPGLPFVFRFNIFVVGVKCTSNVRFFNNRIGYLVHGVVDRYLMYIYLLNNNFDCLPPWSTKYDTAKILVFFSGK